GLVNVRAHSQEHAPRRNGRKIAVLKSVIGLDQMTHAIGFGPKTSAAKDINVDFFGGGLKPANEMAGQANAGNWKAKAARQKQVNGAEADGISRAAVHHAIDVAVFRMIAVMLVALKTEFLEKVFVYRPKNLLRLGGKIDSLAQCIPPGVVKGAIAFQIRVWILCLGEKANRHFEVQFLAVVQAE